MGVSVGPPGVIVGVAVEVIVGVDAGVEVDVDVGVGSEEVMIFPSVPTATNNEFPKVTLSRSEPRPEL